MGARRVPSDERVAATGFRFPEGPSIDRDGGVVLVELGGRCVSCIDPDGVVSTVAVLGGSPNGTAFDTDGVLYVCDGGGRWSAETSTGGLPGPGDGRGLVHRVWPDGRCDVFLSEIDGVALFAPNDCCFDRDGGLWFTDPAWPGADGVIPPGSICFTTLDGRARRVHTGLRFPNGLGVTADGRSLVVAESATNRLVAFPILGPGRVGEPTEFGFMGKGVLPDGLCFDIEGRVLCAGHGGSCIVVFPPGGGDPETIVEMDDRDVTNLCFGGPDLSTLYVTESDAGRVVTVPWSCPGMPLFAQLG